MARARRKGSPGSLKIILDYLGKGAKVTGDALLSGAKATGKAAYNHPYITTGLASAGLYGSGHVLSQLLRDISPTPKLPKDILAAIANNDGTVKSAGIMRRLGGAFGSFVGGLDNADTSLGERAGGAFKEYGGWAQLGKDVGNVVTAPYRFTRDVLRAANENIAKPFMESAKEQYANSSRDPSKFQMYEGQDLSGSRSSTSSSGSSSSRRAGPSPSGSPRVNRVIPWMRAHGGYIGGGIGALTLAYALYHYYRTKKSSYNGKTKLASKRINTKRINNPFMHKKADADDFFSMYDGQQDASAAQSQVNAQAQNAAPRRYNFFEGIKNYGKGLWKNTASMAKSNPLMFAMMLPSLFEIVPGAQDAWKRAMHPELYASYY